GNHRHGEEPVRPVLEPTERPVTAPGALPQPVELQAAIRGLVETPRTGPLRRLRDGRLVPILETRQEVGVEGIEWMIRSSGPRRLAGRAARRRGEIGGRRRRGGDLGTILRATHKAKLLLG